MQFAWPAMLWSLLLLPLLALGYWLALRQHRRRLGRLASLRLVAEAMNGASLLRHVPPLLLLAALGALLLSMARPTAVLPLASHHETVILAIDVSHSMRAEDVYPNRLAAAREAAKAFVAAQPRGTRIGVVAFSGDAALVQAPTADHDELAQAIDGLHTQDATAIGAAIEVALQALDPGLPPASAAVILLSDGQNTAGPDAMERAQLAVKRGIRIYTVGFGTASGTVVGGPGWSVHVYLDEALLRDIAEATGAEYMHAETATELKRVYESLTASLTLERRSTELTALLCAAAALAALMAAGISLVSFGRIA